MATTTKPLTKTQLIEALATKASTDKKTAAAFLGALTELVHGTLKKGGEVKLPDLGKFKVMKRKARMGRNPATGEAIKIPAKIVAKFYLAKAAKDAAPKK